MKPKKGEMAGVDSKPCQLRVWPCRKELLSLTSLLRDCEGPLSPVRGQLRCVCVQPGRVTARLPWRRAVVQQVGATALLQSEIPCVQAAGEHSSRPHDPPRSFMQPSSPL